MAVITRCGRNDDIHRLLRAAVCVPTWRYLWVESDGFTFIPALCDTIFGDGRALFRLATCNSRPQFYVIRCDSGWDYSNWGYSPTFGEHTDEIYEELEEQFGSARLDSEEDDPDILADGINPWPALDDENGCAWARMDWPKLPGIETEQVRGDHGFRSHTLLTRAYAFEDQFARWADDGGSAVAPQFY